jgi:hypothetical protein
MISGLTNSIPYKGVIAREEAIPLVAPELPPIMCCLFFKIP